MLQIAFLLMGTEFIRSRALWILCAGALWAAFGVAVLYDTLNGMHYFPIETFAVLLLIESLITLSVASSGIGAQKMVLFFKGIFFLFVAILILTGQRYSNLLLAIVFGFAYFMIGILNITSSIIVRSRRWKKIVLRGMFNIGFAILLFLPYPTHYHGTFAIFLSIVMLTSGIAAINLARKIQSIKDGQSVFELLAPDDMTHPILELDDAAITTKIRKNNRKPLIIHIWTPEGSADAATINRPIVNRYIAAVDRNGNISAGHAALEVPDKLYISLYPENDIDRSPSEFFNTIKATEDNNVPGEFQPNYQTEVDNWCPANFQLRFYQYNFKALENFWQHYRQNEVYNLTYRNCSSSVAYALESALDGVLTKYPGNRRNIFRILIMPELWIAAQIRQRALAMAWTPGLIMDYARALHAIIHPVPRTWYQRFYHLIKRQI